MKNKLRTSVVKRMICLLTAALMILSVGCGKSSNEQASTSESTSVAESMNIKVAAMKGPTAIGMVKLMSDAKKGDTFDKYEFTIAGSADEFNADLLKGDIAIAAVPCNLAANLYNKSNGKIKIVGINTLGVLYFLEKGNTVKSIADLKGKTIYSTGKGTTPEYTLKYLLKSAGIDPEKDVTIEFMSEAAQVSAKLIQSTDSNTVAMLPQPYVTSVMNQNSDIRIALDVTKEWEKINGTDSSVVTGVLVVNTEFANNHKDAVDRFIENYMASVEFVNANVDEAANMVEEADIFKAAIAKKAIPYCNITYIGGEDMKKKVTSYLNVLFEQNPVSIGGKMPGEDFWY